MRKKQMWGEGLVWEDEGHSTATEGFVAVVAAVVVAAVGTENFDGVAVVVAAAAVVVVAATVAAERLCLNAMRE